MERKEKNAPTSFSSGSFQENTDLEKLKRSPFMKRLIEDISKGVDVGHYGYLTFTIVSRYFLKPKEIVDILTAARQLTKVQALALLIQVKQNNYSPPDRQKLQEWSRQQDYQLVQESDQDTASVYRHLSFPSELYSHIQEYYEGKAADQLRELEDKKKEN